MLSSYTWNWGIFGLSTYHFIQLFFEGQQRWALCCTNLLIFSSMEIIQNTPWSWWKNNQIMKGIIQKENKIITTPQFIHFAMHNIHSSIFVQMRTIYTNSNTPYTANQLEVPETRLMKSSRLLKRLPTVSSGAPWLSPLILIPCSSSFM